MQLAHAILSVFVFLAPALAQEKPKPVTVPITLDHNRTIIDVYLPLPDGTTKRVRGWVDNGNPELDIAEPLAQTLGLELKGEGTFKLGDQRPVDPPRSLQIGGMSISFEGVKEAKEIVGHDIIAPGSSAAINIPSTVLRNYDVLFDYPNRQFTIGPPGSISFESLCKPVAKLSHSSVSDNHRPTQAPLGSVFFQNTSFKAQTNPQNGLIQITSWIDGQNYTISFDAGSSTSLLSGELIEKWEKAHPSWPHMTGAISSANLWGAEEEAHWPLLRLPSMDYGGVILKNVVVASFPEKFMKWYQDRAGAQTIGLIGANAFADYRVGIDYAHNTLYVQRTLAKSAPDMDVVGLTLRPEPDEKYTIIGIADYNGNPAVTDVKVGDVLVGVDGAPATGATMGQVWSLLGGTPGTTRTLTLERDGKRFSVDATVRRFLAPAPDHKSAPRK
jgi:hypothetical protein